VRGFLLGFIASTQGLRANRTHTRSQG